MNLLPKGQEYEESHESWIEYRLLILQTLEELKKGQTQLHDDLIHFEKTFNEKILGEEELKLFREMTKDWERYRWLWGLILRISTWTGGIALMIWGAREFIGRIPAALKALFS